MGYSAQEFMTTVPRSANASDVWAERYREELRGIVTRYANRLPRSVQKQLGPSELGHECDRMVVGKMAGAPATNHVADPWASIVGTAIHAFLADSFSWDNTHNDYLRWLTEARVTPDPGPSAHPGTADLYDCHNRALCDHKCQSEGVRAKLKSKGPPRHYYVQLLLYRLGYLHLGLPVERIVLVSWPRTKSTMDDMYVWSHVPVPEDDQLVDDVLVQTRFREQMAAWVREGRLNLMDVPASPEDSECFFCPLYRPQSAYDGGYGCPGTLVNKEK